MQGETEEEETEEEEEEEEAEKWEEIYRGGDGVRRRGPARRSAAVRRAQDVGAVRRR